MVRLSRSEWDITIRVFLRGVGFGSDKWIVRASSNHGAGYTGFYRAKVHGEIVLQ